MNSLSPLPNRSIDWIAGANRSLQSRFANNAGVKRCTQSIAERLSLLLLDRLPADVAQQLLLLLPKEEYEEYNSLHQAASMAADHTIGFTDFIEAASHSLGSNDIEDPIAEEGDSDWGSMSRAVAEAFLWAVVQKVPGELKTRIREQLPLELRSRMDLYSAGADESQVA